MSSDVVTTMNTWYSTATSSTAEGDLYEISFSCSDLPKMDIASDSDPFLVVHLAEGTKKEVELVRTETVWDEQAPSFVKALLLDSAVLSEEKTSIRVSVYDRDSDNDSLAKHDYLGSAHFTRREAVDAFNSGGLVLDIVGKKKLGGRLTVQCYKMANFAATAPVTNANDAKKSPLASSTSAATPYNNNVMTISSYRVIKSKFRDMRVDFFFQFASSRDVKLDRFYCLYKQLPNGVWTCIHRSEVLTEEEKDQNTFQRASLSLVALNAGIRNAKVRFDLLTYKHTGSHEVCGSFVFTQEELEMLSTNEAAERVFYGSEEDPLEKSVLAGGILGDAKSTFTFELYMRNE